MKTQHLFDDVAHAPVASSVERDVIHHVTYLNRCVGRTGGYASALQQRIVGYVITHTQHLVVTEVVVNEELIVGVYFVTATGVDLCDTEGVHAIVDALGVTPGNDGYDISFLYGIL